MKTESTFIIHPSNNEQINALKAFVKALKMKFEIKNEEVAYDKDFVAKIKESKKQFEEGNSTVIKTEDLWK